MTRAFNQQLYRLRLQLDKISLRERYLLLVTLFALVILCFQGGLYATGMHSNEDILARIDTRKSESEKVQQMLTDYQKAINNPAILALQRDNDQLNIKIKKLRENISKISSRLMAPERMNELLRGLLERQNQLSIVEFKVLPVTKIESSVDDRGLFYKHSIEMNLEGRFEALSNYLAEIESSSEYELFWDELIINTENFPNLKIKVQVHTLSQDEDWLNV
jgi:hypothetical protein